MDQDALAEIIAPCGLSCASCMARKGGDIEALSQALRGKLGNFAAFAGRFALMDPVFADYPAFARLLDHFASARCGGCRVGGCIHADCPVHSCVKEKGVTYCFQCREFPCARLDAMPWLKSKWENNNRRMAEVGVKAYYLQIKDLPRYG